ncbi:DUF2381 family protein [Cystobacter fuscus]|uniref:DUF2381 family protein n=1 Tax=Cystobacter fuscus TaxID=43 RepID=UPI002B2CEB2A|nr:DUF2381 family protein [Cystobacter fuscus]
MPPAPLYLLLTLVLRQATPEPMSAPRPSCVDRQRIDLSTRAAAGVQEICITPGGLTGFVFDQPASVDLEEEVRFGRVLRGRDSISFVSPPDLAPGERLRLSVRFERDPPEQGVTFMLVAHPGQVTHQVDVFHDGRSRASLWQEIEEERAKNQRLGEENQSLQGQLNAPGGLLRVFLNGELGRQGIVSRVLSVNVSWNVENSLTVLGGTVFRSFNSVAVQVSVKNNGTAPWRVEKALLVANQGQRLEGIRFGPPQAIYPGVTRAIFVEARAAPGTPLEALTLTLNEEGPRSITMENIPLP